MLRGDEGRRVQREAFDLGLDLDLGELFALAAAVARPLPVVVIVVAVVFVAVLGARGLLFLSLVDLRGNSIGLKRALNNPKKGHNPKEIFELNFRLKKAPKIGPEQEKIY